MELIPANLSLDFIGKRRLFITLSTVINLGIILGIAAFGFNWGVDFAGGSEIELKFEQAVSPASVRKTIEEAGFPDASVQVVGSASENSYLVRVGRISLLTQEDAQRANAALAQKYGQNLTSFDFNQDYGDKIELRFKEAVPADELRQAVSQAGIKVHELRDVPGGYTIITSGISDKVRAALDEAAASKGMAKAELRRVEFVGPQVGKQLRNKGIMAVLLAAIAILIYIAFRFDTRFAPGAVIAMFHDIVVVLGYFLVTRREFNLTTVAVLLTIVGYSVNDTIVIYDRIRENLAKHKALGLAQLINLSINETLPRTVLTGLSSMLALSGLLVFGVGQIWDFAVAMVIGILVGTYSSIYIASPATIWFDEILSKKAQRAPSVAKAS